MGEFPENFSIVFNPLYTMNTKPTKDQVFMAMAFLICRLSPDAETQHGCILVDENYKIVGAGYNGFPRNCDDASLPTTRPDKYPFMIHSEVNALLNAHSSVEGTTAYVTGQCCPNCLMALYHAGVDRIVMGTKTSTMISSTQENITSQFLASCKRPIKIDYFSEDLGFVHTFVQDLGQCNLLKTELLENNKLLIG